MLPGGGGKVVGLAGAWEWLSVVVVGWWVGGLRWVVGAGLGFGRYGVRLLGAGVDLRHRADGSVLVVLCWRGMCWHGVTRRGVA